MMRRAGIGTKALYVFLALAAFFMCQAGAVHASGEQFDWLYIQKRDYEDKGEIFKLGFGIVEDKTANVAEVEVSLQNGTQVEVETPDGNLFSAAPADDDSWYAGEAIGFLKKFDVYSAGYDHYGPYKYENEYSFYLNPESGELPSGNYTVSVTTKDNATLQDSFYYEAPSPSTLPVVKASSVDATFDAENNLECSWQSPSSLPANSPGITYRASLWVYDQGEVDTYLQCSIPAYMNSCTFSRDMLSELRRYGDNATLSVQVRCPKDNLRTSSKLKDIDLSNVPAPQSFSDYKINYARLQKRVNNDWQSWYSFRFHLRDGNGTPPVTDILSAGDVQLELPDGNVFTPDDLRFYGVGQEYYGDLQGDELEIKGPWPFSGYYCEYNSSLQNGNYTLSINNGLGLSVNKTTSYEIVGYGVDPGSVDYSFDDSGNMAINWEIWGVWGNGIPPADPSGASRQVINIDIRDRSGNWQGFLWIPVREDNLYSGYNGRVTVPGSFLRKMRDKGYHLDISVILRNPEDTWRIYSISYEMDPAEIVHGGIDSMSLQNRRYENGTAFNKLSVAYQNDMDAMPKSDTLRGLTLYGPDGQAVSGVNASTAKFWPEYYQWGYYNSTNQFEFGDYRFYSSYGAKIPGILEQGKYKLVLEDENGMYPYTREYTLRGVTDKLPIIPGDTIIVQVHSGGLNATWENPDLAAGLNPEEGLEVNALLEAYAGDTYKGCISVRVPWDLQKVDIPAEELKWLKDMGDNFEFYVRTRTPNNRNRAYSNSVDVDLSGISSPSGDDYVQAAERILLRNEVQSTLTANHLLQKAVGKSNYPPIAQAYLALGNIADWAFENAPDHPADLLHKLGLRPVFDDYVSSYISFSEYPDWDGFDPGRLSAGDATALLDGLIAELGESISRVDTAIADWNGPYIIKTGDGSPDIEVNESDVRLVRAGLKAVKAWAQVVSSYQLGNDLGGLVAKAYDDREAIFRDYFRNNPQALNLTADGPTRIADARQLLIQAITEYDQAMRAILNDTEHQSGAEELLVISSDPDNSEALDKDYEAFVRRELNKIKDALQNESITYTLQETGHGWQLESDQGHRSGMWYDTVNGHLTVGEYWTRDYTGDFIAWDAGVRSVNKTDTHITWELEFHGSDGYEKLAVLEGGLFTNSSGGLTVPDGTYTVYNGSSTSDPEVDSGGFSARRTDLPKDRFVVNPSPFFGAGNGPYNMRDILPRFHVDNNPVLGTFGNGLGNDPTLGGILPEFTQTKWMEEEDLAEAITLRDAIRAMQILCGASGTFETELWDINGNGVLDMAEVVFALQYTAGEK